MPETRDDLREALARYIIGPRCPVPPTSKFTLAELQEVTWRRATSQEAGNARWIAERMLSGPLAPILAQVSALQAEVERERHNKEQWRDQSYENAKAADRLAAEVERLQKVEGERERLGRALGVSVAVLDRAAGEGIMFLPGDDGSPEMDAADACEIISTVIEAEIDGPVWRALLATGWKRLSPSDNPLAGTKEGSDA